jgi:hypothetical protein
MYFFQHLQIPDSLVCFLFATYRNSNNKSMAIHTYLGVYRVSNPFVSTWHVFRPNAHLQLTISFHCQPNLVPRHTSLSPPTTKVIPINNSERKCPSACETLLERVWVDNLENQGLVLNANVHQCADDDFFPPVDQQGTH